MLRKHGLEGPDFEFRLEHTYPPREIITQWRETDLEFIRRILSEVGIYWRTEMDDVRGLDTYMPYISQTLHDSEHPDPVTRDNHTRNGPQPRQTTRCG